MNKVYRIVWNAARNCYVVASEFASNKDAKGAFYATSVRKIARRAMMTAVLTMACLLTFGFVPTTGGHVYAEDSTTVATTQTGWPGASSNFHQYVVISSGGKLDNRTNGINTSSWQTVYVTANDGVVSASANGWTQYTGAEGQTRYVRNAIKNANGEITGWETGHVYDESTDGELYEYDLTTVTGHNGNTLRVRKGYSVEVESKARTEASTGSSNVFKATWIGSGQAPSDVLTTIGSVNSLTGTKTNINESLQQVNASSYVAASNGGVEVNSTWNYVIYDPDGSYGWNTTGANGGYYTTKPSESFVTVTDGTGQGLHWNATQQAYVYNNGTTTTTVDPSNLYVIGGKLGIFVSKDKSTVYTGHVYGSNNEVLMTAGVTASDGTVTYYSYWGGEANDASTTMSTYTLREYNNDLATLESNDEKLAHNDINHVGLGSKSTNSTTGNSTSTISLYRNGTDMTGNSVTVDGAITITDGGGGTDTDPNNSSAKLTGNGYDRTLTISVANSNNTTSTQTYKLGSTVSVAQLDKDGNTATATTPVGERTTKLTVNGTTWDIAPNGYALNEDTLSHRIFQGDETATAADANAGKVDRKLGDTLYLSGGQGDKTKLTTLADQNIGVIRNDDSTGYNILLSKDLKGMNSTTYNQGDNYTVVNDGGIIINGGGSNHTDINHNTVAVTNKYISAGGQQIHNVAPGTADTDAVNVSQLKNAINTNVGHEINKLGDRIDKVGAGAAALAGLHPQDFNPDDKWDFAAGYGHYRSANAVAVGAFYRPTEDIMFSVGGSTGGGEDMVNVGLTFKLGPHDHVTNSRVAMAKQILAMQTKMDAMAKEIQTLKAGGATGTGTVQQKELNFPDVPENHWAYEYVQTLAHRGLLTGYPDGKFKGDRPLTRYEYAAIVYRALQNGAPVDGNMARSMDEFGDEIADVQKAYRFRVDRVSGDENDRHKIERVRVNDKDDAENNDYRDVYGSKIQKTIVIDKNK